jgi:uncharacterized protein with HEPN domain
VTRHDDARLDDISAAILAIQSHLARGTIEDGMVFDAVRVRLIEIGEAVRALSPDLVRREPEIPWADIGGMRNFLAHRCFDVAHSIVATTVQSDLPPLASAVDRLRGR